MIAEKMLVKNDTFIKPTIITPQYIIVHSTGVGYTSKDALFTRWNNPDKLSIHGIVDDSGSYQTLPLNYLAWHVGKKGNAKTVGFEICEPKNIVYSDLSHTEIDIEKYNPNIIKNRVDFLYRFFNAVELATNFCFRLHLTEEKILSHREAHAIGIASNHADVEHWFNIFEVSMDDFRQEVKKRLNRKINPSTGG